MIASHNKNLSLFLREAFEVRQDQGTDIFFINEK